jgi:YbbR domain-containing protein
MVSWLKANWRLKLVALVTSVLVWFFVNETANDRSLIQAVPLEVRARPGMVVLAQSASRVDVLVRGTREDVRRVTRSDLQVVLDLSRETRRGELERGLSPRDIGHPRRVMPVEVVPRSIKVTLDEVQETTLPVTPRFVGELPPGYAIERVVVKPESVPATGPRSQLTKLGALETLPIDVNGRRTSFREWVELSPVPGELPGGRRWVEVDVRIGTGPAVDTPPRRGDNGGGTQP